MKRLKAIVVILILVTAFSSAPIGVVRADISVISSDYVNKFPDGVEFTLETKDSAAIKNITLSYTVDSGNGPVDAYDKPKFDAGTSVKTSYMLEKRKIYLPPGTVLSYKWTIENESGGKVETEPVKFTYEDTRFTWRSLSKDGVTIYWYDWHPSSPDIARQALDEALASITRLSAQVGFTYSKPMKIFGYASKKDMDPALQLRSAGFSSEIVTLGQRTTAEIMLLLLNHFEFKETVAHEVSHMVIHQLADGPYSSLPAWLDEGLAMNAEKVVPQGYISELKKGIQTDELISVQSLGGVTGEPKDVMLFYGQSYSIVKFLVDNYGRGKIVEILNVLKTGTLINEALKQVYGFDVDGLDAKWRAGQGLKPRAVPQGGSAATVLGIPTIVPYGSQPSASQSAAAKPDQSGSGARSGEVGTNKGGIPLLPVAGGVAMLMIVGAGAVVMFTRRSQT
ncbi:MAG: hypothetical protein EXR50_00975 [Dehalococcoidia bacterium]|nr:hypothetical protein [Dehalococcoidia bacterium]